MKNAALLKRSLAARECAIATVRSVTLRVFALAVQARSDGVTSWICWLPTYAVVNRIGGGGGDGGLPVVLNDRTAPKTVPPKPLLAATR